MAGVNPSQVEKMKRLVQVAMLALAAVSIARAQDERTFSSPANATVTADFANTAAAWVLPKSGDALLFARPSGFGEPRSLALAVEALPALPDPKFVYGSRDDYRWQLALGVTLMRFRSSKFYATGAGTDTTLTYFTNEWFGVEGKITTFFAPTINQNEHIKYFSYGGGPKVAWRARKWEPWMHFITGGAHIQPQTANNSRNGLELMAGGGTDYRILPHLSARVEIDWTRTRLFNEWQNSAQANADIVLHF
jgi:hypothetical protein